jgi:hypothetical protein
MPRAPYQSFRIGGPFGPKAGIIAAASSAGGISLSRFALALAILFPSPPNNMFTTQSHRYSLKRRNSAVAPAPMPT